jgi:hypothetical protein
MINRKTSVSWVFLFCVAAAAFCQTADAGSGASAGSNASAVPQEFFLGFPSKAAFHRAGGWTSAGLFFAAGVVGTVRAVDMMNRGHQRRDALGISGDDNFGGAAGAAALHDTWAESQALRWVHVGLIAAGETVYLGDAITGLSMKIPLGSRTLNSDLHLTAFFAHAALMAAEVVLGFLGTDALSRGDHEAMLGIGAAHIAIGFAIPLVIAGAGWAIDTPLFHAPN